jgi:putative FmdB family regulatory protein
MPIYEYRCSACGHELEAIQRFSDAPLAACPVCGKPTLVKLVSAAGFQLKGSGWYATDFKGSGSKPAATKSDTGTQGDGKSAMNTDSKSDAASGSESPSKTDAKTETKVESKSESAPAAKPVAPATGS